MFGGIFRKTYGLTLGSEVEPDRFTYPLWLPGTAYVGKYNLPYGG